MSEVPRRLRLTVVERLRGDGERLREGVLGGAVDLALDAFGKSLDQPFDRRADDPGQPRGKAGAFELADGAGEEGEVWFREFRH